MRKVRKNYGDEWIAKLMSFKDRLQEPTLELDAMVNQVQSMRSAQDNNARESETTPCKRQSSGNLQGSLKKSCN